MEVDDEVGRLCRGDLEAVDGLLVRYQNRLYRYLLRLVREPATAEDLFQQTWVRVMEHIHRYDPRKSFEAWLFAVARNLAIDHLRRYRPESLDEPLPSGQEREELLPANNPSALELLLAQEQTGALSDAVGELPVMYREVLTLRFEEEMKIEEIAAVLGLPVPTTKTRLRRALERLRRHIEAGFMGNRFERT